MTCEGGVAQATPGHRRPCGRPGAACLEVPAAPTELQGQRPRAACFPGWAPCFSLCGAESPRQAALAILCLLWPSRVTGVWRERSRAWAGHGGGWAPPCTPPRSRGSSGPPGEDRERRACLARRCPCSTARPSPRPPSLPEPCLLQRSSPLGHGGSLTAAPTGVSPGGNAQ